MLKKPCITVNRLLQPESNARLRAFATSVYYKQEIKPFEAMPGPLPLGFMGTLYQYAPFFGRFSMSKHLESGLKRLQLYGPIVREEIKPGVRLVYLFNPDDIEKLFQCEAATPMRRSHLALEKYRLDRPHVYNSAGLLPTNGETWLQLRKIFQKGLLTIADVHGFLKESDVIVQEWIDRLDHFPSKDYLPILSRLYLELLGYVTMDMRFGSFQDVEFYPGSRTSKLLKAAVDTNSTIMKTDRVEIWRQFETPLYRKLRKAQEYMESVAIDVVATKMSFYYRDFNKEDQPLTLLEKYLSSPQLDMKDIIGVISDFLLAGMDTTANTSSFMLHYIAKHPEVQQKLYEESRRVLPNPSDPVTVEILQSIPYARAVLKETYRLRPISVGVGRILTNDTVFSGYSVPAGAIVVTQNQVICLLEEYFPDPEEFRPERWLTSEKRHKYLLLPFGHGLRQCIARRFAEQNMLLLLVKLMRNYQVGWRGRDVGFVTEHINRPDGPITLVFKKRDR